MLSCCNFAIILDLCCMAALYRDFIEGLAPELLYFSCRSLKFALQAVSAFSLFAFIGVMMLIGLLALGVL